MALAIKRLGAVDPPATTETDLYTVPSLTSVVSSSIVVCNRSSVAATCRISHSVGGGATANEDYLFYDFSVDGNDSFIATIGATLGPDDVIRVYTDNATVSFTIYGQEVDAQYVNVNYSPLVNSSASTASLTMDCSTYDTYELTALAANLTINTPIGTPANFQKLTLCIKDNATSRTLTFSAGFAEFGVTLPTTTVASKRLQLGFEYLSANSKWNLIAKTQEL